MPQCGGTKRDGSRCVAVVDTISSYCYHHDPTLAEKRRRVAARGGKSAANQEIRTTKDQIRGIIAKVYRGQVDRNDATAIFAGYRVLLDYIRLERAVKVEDELAFELEEIKRERSISS